VLRTLILASLCWLSSSAQAQVAFHLAYHADHPGAIPASFPNDRLFRYISVEPYIPSSDLRSAIVMKTEHGYAIEITISTAAREKLNALAEDNAKALKDRDFNAQFGIGLVVDGKPRRVIQGVHRLESDVLWLSLDYNVSDAETLKEADLWAERINGANGPSGH
jgi:hypothetical protein